MMKITKMAALGLAAFAASAGGQAAVAAERSSGSEGRASAAQAPATKAGSEEDRRYCVSLPPEVVSRLPRLECKTKQQWVEAGAALAPRK